MLLLCWQPEAALQVSSVQGLPSLQSGGVPPAHAPAEQTSFVVQALPSLQDAVLFAKTHPTIVSQASSVQGLLSLQVAGPPLVHAPAWQVSPTVHALPSSQGPETGIPPWHWMPAHVSPEVHAFPSAQAPVT